MKLLISLVRSGSPSGSIGCSNPLVPTARPGRGAVGFPETDDERLHGPMMVWVKSRTKGWITGAARASNPNQPTLSPDSTLTWKAKRELGAGSGVPTSRGEREEVFEAASSDGARSPFDGGPHHQGTRRPRRSAPPVARGYAARPTRRPGAPASTAHTTRSRVTPSSRSTIRMLERVSEGISAETVKSVTLRTR